MNQRPQIHDRKDHGAGIIVVENRWGQGRIEVRAIRALILQRLDAGFTIRRIWRELTGQGKISVALSNFYIQVEKIQRDHQAERRLSGHTPVSRTAIKPQPAPAPQQAADTTIPQFRHDPVSGPLVLTPAGEDADQREQDDNAS